MIYRAQRLSSNPKWPNLEIWLNLVLRSKVLYHLLRNREFCHRLKMAVSSTPCFQPQIITSQSPLRFFISLLVNCYNWCFSWRLPDFLSVFLNFVSPATKVYSGLKLQSASGLAFLSFSWCHSSICPPLNYILLSFIIIFFYFLRSIWRSET